MSGLQEPDLRPYVVVSADAHVAPDDLEQFLSYVDPAFRGRIAEFGALTATALSMFGGVDPGAVDDPDPVRAKAIGRLRGMGVDTALWGFDPEQLQAVADRVGPTVEDLASPLSLDDIPDTFSWSLAKPVPVLAGEVTLTEPG